MEIGGMEWIIIILAVLVLFGAKKIPDLARGLAQGINEFRRAANDIRSEVESAGKSVNRDDGHYRRPDPLPDRYERDEPVARYQQEPEPRTQQAGPDEQPANRQEASGEEIPAPQPEAGETADHPKESPAEEPEGRPKDKKPIDTNSHA